MLNIIETLKKGLKMKKHLPSNLNDAVSVLGYITQTFGFFILHIVVTLVVVFGAYFVIRIALISPSWFMIIISIVLIASSLVSIAAIIIDISDIVYLIQELRNGNYKKR